MRKISAAKNCPMMRQQTYLARKRTHCETCSTTRDTRRSRAPTRTPVICRPRHRLVYKASTIAAISSLNHFHCLMVLLKMNLTCLTDFDVILNYSKVAMPTMACMSTALMKMSLTGHARSAKSACLNSIFFAMIIRADAQNSSKSATKTNFCKIFYRNR